MPFAVVCNLKKESDSAQAYANFPRDAMDVRRHLKQRHATATCEGIRVSVRPSPYELVPNISQYILNNIFIIFYYIPLKFSSHPNLINVPNGHNLR